MKRFSIALSLNLINPKPYEIIHITNLIYVANSCEKHNITYNLIDINKNITTSSVSCRIQNMRILGYLSNEDSVVPDNFNEIVNNFR